MTKVKISGNSREIAFNRSKVQGKLALKKSGLS